MEDRLRSALEQAAVQGYTFSPSPKWHFLFIENTEILQDLLGFTPETGKEELTDAVIVFSDPSPAAAADACAGLNRMYAAVQNTGARFSEALTILFSAQRAEPLKEAFGVPADYICTGAIVLGGVAAAAQEPVRWDVFSYMK